LEKVERLRGEGDVGQSIEGVVEDRLCQEGGRLMIKRGEVIVINSVLFEEEGRCGRRNGRAGQGKPTTERVRVCFPCAPSG
jgi:hypothetical protein